MGTAFPGGKPPANSVAGKGNSGVMANVLAKEGTIGYVDLGDAKGYPSARIQNAKGEFIAPSSASAAKNLANQTNVAANGLVKLNYKLAVSGAYPISIFSYGLARTDGKGPNGLGVRQFWDYTLAKCGPSRAASLGYVPVAGKVLAKARQLVQQHQVAPALEYDTAELRSEGEDDVSALRQGPRHRPHLVRRCGGAGPVGLHAAPAAGRAGGPGRGADRVPDGRDPGLGARDPHRVHGRGRASASAGCAPSRPCSRCRPGEAAPVALVDKTPTPGGHRRLRGDQLPGRRDHRHPGVRLPGDHRLQRHRPRGRRHDSRDRRRHPQRDDHVVGGPGDPGGQRGLRLHRPAAVHAS